MIAGITGRSANDDKRVTLQQQSPDIADANFIGIRVLSVESSAQVNARVISPVLLRAAVTSVFSFIWQYRWLSRRVRTHVRNEYFLIALCIIVGDLQPQGGRKIGKIRKFARNGLNSNFFST